MRPGTPSAELKIYPNLFAHVGESVEGLLRRPYGCGEQTIDPQSQTGPNPQLPEPRQALLPAMRDAIEAVAAGRPPDAVAADRVRHDFEGFAILAPPAEGTGG